MYTNNQNVTYSMQLFKKKRRVDHFLFFFRFIDHFLFILQIYRPFSPFLS